MKEIIQTKRLRVRAHVNDMGQLPKIARNGDTFQIKPDRFWQPFPIDQPVRVDSCQYRVKRRHRWIIFGEWRYRLVIQPGRWVTPGFSGRREFWPQGHSQRFRLDTDARYILTG